MTTVLILGGLAGDGPRQLLPYLFSSDSPSKPAFCRVVDRHLAIPSSDAYTFFADGRLKQTLKKGAEDKTIEYMQGNLMTEATRTKVFTLPEAHGKGSEKGFDYVFDFTGEADFRAPDIVHVDRTLRLALLLGEAAVNAKVGAYVRALPSFSKLKSDSENKKGLKVGSEGAGDVEPWGTLSKWHHEAARGLAKIQGLSLVLLRPAIFYGDYTVTGVTPRLLLGEVYKFENEKMDFLWSENLSCNTCHIDDFASALVAAASFAHCLGSRSAILDAYSVNLPPAFDSNKPFEPLSSGPPVVAAKKEEKDIRACVFNVEDGGDTNQKMIAKLIEESIGVKTGFHGAIVSTFAKLNLGDVVEDANEKHLEGWSALLQASNPPINTTVPISPSVPVDLLSPYPVSLDSTALKKLTGWSPSRRLDVATVKASIEGFRKEGFWPNAAPRKSK